MLALSAFSFGIAQSTSVISDDEQKVRSVITDFNKAVFCEADLLKAFEKYYYLKEPDDIDLRSGIDADFSEITRKSDQKDKIRQFALQFYFENWVQLLNWKLGTNTVSENTKFVDFEIAEDKDLIKIWATALKENDITEEELDQIGNVKKNLDFYEHLFGMWSEVLTKNTDKKLLDKNLRYIDKHTEIKKIVFEDRVYFEVKNKLFFYGVGIKDGTPKIMKITRNSNS